MTATLTFQLPEDQDEFRLAIDGYKWSLVCWEMDQSLRNKIKYGNHPEEVMEALEKIREELHTELAEKGLVLD